MRELLRRVRYLFRRREAEDELADELAFHREMARHELEGSGVSPPDAAAAARRALGNDLAARQYARDVWIAPWLHDVIKDASYAVRLLVRERGFAAAAVLILGRGIGISNMQFTILYAHTLRNRWP